MNKFKDSGETSTKTSMEKFENPTLSYVSNRELIHPLLLIHYSPWGMLLFYFTEKITPVN
jgi:hypothetical protein